MYYFSINYETMYNFRKNILNLSKKLSFFLPFVAIILYNLYNFRCLEFNYTSKKYF